MISMEILIFIRIELTLNLRADYATFTSGLSLHNSGCVLTQLRLVLTQYQAHAFLKLFGYKKIVNITQSRETTQAESKRE